VTRRAARSILLALGAGLILLLIFLFRGARRHLASPPAPAPETEAGGRQPTAILSGFDYSETLEGKPFFRIHADRTFGYAGGESSSTQIYELRAVTLTVYPAEGPPLVVHGDRAEVDAATHRAKLSGNVRVTDPRGATTTTDAIQFDPTTRTARTAGPARFQWSTMLARAAAVTYDMRSGVADLSGPVTASSAGAVPPAGFGSVRSDRAQYRRGPGELFLSGHVEASRPGQRLSAETLLLQLSADRKRVAWATSAGNVQGVVSGLAGEKAREVQLFRADRSTFAFGPDGDLTEATLEGAPASIDQAPGVAGVPARRLAAMHIAIQFRDGRPIQADARGTVRLTETASPGGSVGPRTTTAREALATYDRDGQVRAVRFAGDVVSEATDFEARAPEAVYDVADNVVILRGADGKSAHARSGANRVSADRIEIRRSRSLLTAEGDARGTFLRKAGEQSRVPGFLAGSREPSFGKADRMTLDDAAHTADLDGHAALWQEDTCLLADEIFLNGAQKTAHASGHVRAVLRTETEPARERDRPAVAAKNPLTLVASRTMDYAETDHTLEFRDGVSLRRAGAIATGDRAVAVLGEAQRVETVTITGNVHFDDPATGRRGSGQEAVDDVGRGVVVLSGTPAEAADLQGNRVEGAILTFRKGESSVEVAAPDGGKSVTTYRTH
jgi:LPS export ABC transporter protein LptC